MPQNNDDNPDVLDSTRVVQWLEKASRSPTSGGESIEDESVARPLSRPPVPVLTVLDDGGFRKGEEIRLRGEEFSIGRTSGDMIFTDDRTMSCEHAAIRRVRTDRGWQWVLVDRGSSNGTLVKIVSAALDHGTLMVIGQQRLRFVMSNNVAVPASDGTDELDKRTPAPGGWPKLCATNEQSQGLNATVNKKRVTIGRLGGGCDIELDDHCVASHHATIMQGPRGHWRIEAEKSVNGTWVHVSKAILKAKSFFRCGEYWFMFDLP